MGGGGHIALEGLSSATGRHIKGNLHK